jgi:hypothetical protein
MGLSRRFLQCCLQDCHRWWKFGLRCLWGLFFFSGGGASHSLPGVGFFGADDGVSGGCSNVVPPSSAASSSMAVDASPPSTGRKLVAAVRSSSMVWLGGDLSTDCCCSCSSRFEASCGDRGWNLVPASAASGWGCGFGVASAISKSCRVLCVRWGLHCNPLLFAKKYIYANHTSRHRSVRDTQRIMHNYFLNQKRCCFNTQICHATK